MTWKTLINFLIFNRSSFLKSSYRNSQLYYLYYQADHHWLKKECSHRILFTFFQIIHSKRLPPFFFLFRPSKRRDDRLDWTHATSSPKSLIFLWQVSRRESRDDELAGVVVVVVVVVLPPPPPWWTGVAGADIVDEDDDTPEVTLFPSWWSITRAGERNIIPEADVTVVAVIVAAEDDLFGGPPTIPRRTSWPRIFSRTLGMHQILISSHRTFL